MDATTNYWISAGTADFCNEVSKRVCLRSRPALAVLEIFFIQLFPNWTACSPITDTNFTDSVQLLLLIFQHSSVELVSQLNEAIVIFSSYI